MYKLTASEIVKLIHSRQTSAVEISQSFIERTQIIDPIIQAWASMDASYIQTQAKKIDQMQRPRLLTGVPIGIKDIFNTEVYPTEKGTLAWKNYKAGNDARCVSYLKNEDAIVFGKTDTAELAVHAGGKAKNPHHISHVTGSSSGGSAAAVATAMVPVALGTQTAGSIIRPASWCGIYAMKPSFGLIPRTGVLKTTDTLDSIGFFARSHQDLELLFDTLRVHGDNFPIQEQKLNSYKNNTLENYRIAFIKNVDMNNTVPYVLDEMENFKNDLKKLRNIEVIELILPTSTNSFHELHRRIYHPCLAYYLKNEFRKNPEYISENLKNIFDDAALIPPSDYAKALTEQSHMAAELEAFFMQNRIDAVITHSSNGSAPIEAEPSRHFDFNPLWTMTWLPVINIPKFKCKKNLPFGIQVIGPRYSDYRLFKILNHFGLHNLIPNKSEIALSSIEMNQSTDLIFAR